MGDEEGELVWRLSHHHQWTGDGDAPTRETEISTQQTGKPQLRDSEPDVQGIEGEEDHEPQTTQDHHDIQEQHQHRVRDSDSEPDASPQALNIRPQREQRRPRMLTYDAMGQPTVREAGMDNIEVGTPAHSFHGLWRPWMLTGIKTLC